MATIAAQVVLHPAVSQALKFGGTTLGRDKTYRTIQYFSRFLAWHFGVKGNKLEAARWAGLKNHLGTARKLMRLGKPMEHLQAALRATFSSGPLVETLTTIARQIGYFGYLTYDMFVWAHTVKLISLSTEASQRVAKRAFQFWFAGIAFSIVHGILKSERLKSETRALHDSKTWGEKDLADEAARETRLSAIREGLRVNRLQLTIDLLDVWIPAAGSGILQTSEGTLGIVGMISSILGARAQWEAVNGKK